MLQAFPLRLEMRNGYLFSPLYSIQYRKYEKELLGKIKKQKATKTGKEEITISMIVVDIILYKEKPIKKSEDTNSIYKI